MPIASVKTCWSSETARDEDDDEDELLLENRDDEDEEDEDEELRTAIVTVWPHEYHSAVRNGPTCSAQLVLRFPSIGAARTVGRPTAPVALDDDPAAAAVVAVAVAVAVAAAVVVAAADEDDDDDDEEADGLRPERAAYVARSETPGPLDARAALPVSAFSSMCRIVEWTCVATTSGRR